MLGIRSVSVWAVGLMAMAVAVSVSASAQEVRITYTPPKPGQVTVKSSSADMAMKVTAKGEGVPPQIYDQSMTQTMRTRRTILDVKDGVVTRAKIAFEVAEGSERGPEGARSGNKPIAGKTYVLEVKGRGVSMATEDGKRPSQEEANLVREEDAKEVGRLPVFVGFFKDRVFMIGQPVKPDAAAVQQLFGEGFEVESATMTLKGVRGDAAVFAMDVTMVQDQGYMKMTIPMKGDVEMGISNGWPLALALSGTIQFAAGQGEPGDPKLTFDGGGTMKIAVTFDYSGNGGVK